jgi:hypothetical protein
MTISPLIAVPLSGSTINIGIMVLKEADNLQLTMWVWTELLDTMNWISVSAIDF